MSLRSDLPSELFGPGIPKDIAPSSQGTCSTEESKLTRRAFVTTVGTITGGVIMGLPGLRAEHSPGAFIAEPQLAAPVDAAHAVAVQMTINGQPQQFSLDPRVTLLDLLRENLVLTGTKKGCDHGQCGACTVLVNDVRINSCLTLAVTHDGDRVTTIEGIASGQQLHPLQAAFLEHDGFQCGYCTPGQICSGVALLWEADHGDASYVTADLTKKMGRSDLTPDEIRERMSGNICRCGAYPGIVRALQTVNSHT